MDTKTVNYEEDKKVYYKVLVGLLLLTAVTFIQPHLFMTHSTFLAQMLIALVKGWLIVMYYMHLKGEKLITAMVWFALALVTVFFIIVNKIIPNPKAHTNAAPTPIACTPSNFKPPP